MRLWTLHPSSLDRAGLIACWREGKLARAVIAGQTKGYRNHPQLGRFRAHSSPLKAIDAYLHGVADEADRRGYHFDRASLGQREAVDPIPVQSGQVDFEFFHLLHKIRTRKHPERGADLRVSDAVHTIFEKVPGIGREPWERS